MVLVLLVIGDLGAVEVELELIEVMSQFTGLGHIKLGCGVLTTHGHENCCHHRNESQRIEE